MLKKLKNVNLFLVIMIVAFAFGISLKIVFADYLFQSSQAQKGVTLGNTGINLGNIENLFYGLIKSDSTGSFILLQDSNGSTYTDKFILDHSGNITAAGNIEASGNMKASGQNVCLQNGTNCPAAGIPSDLVAGLSVVSDAEVDNNITLTNITQITNRSHSNLSGLDNDDHTQYLRADGTRAMSGALTANGGINLQNSGDTDYKIEGRRSIGEYPGWDANRLYINGYNDWSSGVTVAGAGLNVDAGLNVAGAIKQGGTNVSLSGHTHSAGDITSGTLLTGRGGTGLSATGVSGNLLRSNGSTWESWTPNYLTSEVDGSVTNEIQTLGTSGNTITLSLGGGSVTAPYASNADTVDSQHYNANWPTTLTNMKTAVSNDFHNLGGTDNVGVTAHSALSGLGNDDHTQYLRADGTRIMTGSLSVAKASGENDITAINALVGYYDLYLKGSSAEDKPIYYGASEHKFYTGKTERARIDSSGNLTVGGNINASGGINTASNITASQIVTTGAIAAGGNITAAGQSLCRQDGTNCPAVGAEVIGNEVTDATNSTLTRSGSGTAAAPYKLSLNLANSNTWTGTQTFATLKANNINSDSNIKTGETIRIDNAGNLTNIGNISASGLINATGSINTSGNIKTGGTARIDSSGNLTNIGTISTTGLINTTGNIKASGAVFAVKFLTSEGATLTIPSGVHHIVVSATAEMIKQLPENYGRTCLATYYADGVVFAKAEVGAGNNNGAQARLWASTTGEIDVTGKSSKLFK